MADLNRRQQLTVAGSVVDEQERLSMTDGLTAVTNRRGFDLQLSARTTPSRQQTPPLSLVMIDVDHFKSINDSQGHATGDAVLKSLAQVLRGALRPDDVLARFGGEEVVALLPGCPLPEALAVAEKLRAAVEAHDYGCGRPVTASFGVAELSAGRLRPNRVPSPRREPFARAGFRCVGRDWRAFAGPARTDGGPGRSRGAGSGALRR